MIRKKTWPFFIGVYKSVSSCLKSCIICTELLAGSRWGINLIINFSVQYADIWTEIVSLSRPTLIKAGKPELAEVILSL